MIIVNNYPIKLVGAKLFIKKFTINIIIYAYIFIFDFWSKASRNGSDATKVPSSFWSRIITPFCFPFPGFADRFQANLAIVCHHNKVRD